MGIILASSSPRRRELMALITPDYTVRTSDVDERAIRAETPALLAQKLAAAKCRAVAESCPEDVVIGCDTVVDVDGAVFGKPCGPGRRAAHDTRSGGQGPPGAHRRVHCRTGTGAVLRRNHKSGVRRAFGRGDRGVHCDRRPLRQGRGLRRAERRGQICGRVSRAAISM